MVLHRPVELARVIGNWLLLDSHIPASERNLQFEDFYLPRHPSILQSSFSRPFAAQWRRLIVGRDGEHSSEPAPFRRPFLDPCFLSTAGFVEWRSAGSAILPSLAGRGGGDAAPVSRIILVCSSFSFSRRSSFLRFCTTCCPAP